MELSIMLYTLNMTFISLVQLVSNIFWIIVIIVQIGCETQNVIRILVGQAVLELLIKT